MYKPGRQRAGYAPALTLFLMVVAALNLSSQHVDMTAFMPSPSGIFRSLISTGGAAGAPFNTLLNRDAGAVGVRNAAPRTTLDVNGEIAAVNRLTLAKDTTRTSHTWHLDNTLDGTNRFRIFDQPNIGVAGTERLSITPAGNVGIGAGVGSPASPAPNGAASGNLDVNDVLLRGAPGGARWASQGTGVKAWTGNFSCNLPNPNCWGTAQWVGPLGFTPDAAICAANQIGRAGSWSQIYCNATVFPAAQMVLFQVVVPSAGSSFEGWVGYPGWSFAQLVVGH